MRRLLELAAGLLLRRIVGPPAGARRAAPAAPARSRPDAARGSGAAAPAATRTAPPGRPRGPLVAAMLASLVVGALLMLLFEAWFTRLIGVLALFTFVVTGVFAITGSGLLDAEEDG